MVKVKVVYINGKETEYNVEYPKAYIAKIMESENGLMLDQKSVKEIYKEDKLIAKFTNGFLNELELEKPEPKKRSKSTQEAIADQQDINRKLKDKIKADEDWNEYQADIWVTDHTGGNVDLNYIPKSL
jgi:NACalpha-BTF3-like transcription factor